jgi:hypothetical protein
LGPNDKVNLWLANPGKDLLPLKAFGHGSYCSHTPPGVVQNLLIFETDRRDTKPREFRISMLIPLAVVNWAVALDR